MTKNNKFTMPKHFLEHLRHLKSLVCTAILISGLIVTNSVSAATDLAQSPILSLKTAPGLVMLNLGRDLPLSKAAYNDVNDLDGDGNPDLFFKPGFKYEGYFAYNRCYSYDSSLTGTTSSTGTNGVFKPDSIGTLIQPDASDKSKNYYKCPGKWSGNFLNWVTMSRIDALRKVLYGGKRSIDTASSTVLERSYIPQDATIWAKDYASVGNDGYSIADYTPLAIPEAGKRHQFANVTKLDGNALYTLSNALNPPQLVIYQNQTQRVWQLIAVERRILGTTPVGAGGVGPLTVRIKTCVPLGSPTKYEDGCTPYVNGSVTTYKPTGLLQRYGEAKTLAFGLLSGTYDKNYSGGVLRQNIDDFKQEVTATTGVFTSVKGIVYHLNELRPWGFGAPNSEWDCGFKFDTQRTEGTCGMWGNPLGEMMYETLRYFSGEAAGTPAFTTGVGSDRVIDNGKTVKSPEPSSKLDLQRPAWINPYVASSGRSSTAAYPKCARPVQMVIGDPKTSFDSDQLPGIDANFGTFAGSLGSLNVSAEANNIWASEFGTGAVKNFFMGQVGSLKDGNPSSKTATTFANMRGHGPDATTNQGSFYGASVARYGKFTGLSNPALTEPLRVDQISIALDSAVPQIKIPLNGRFVSIVPLSKSIGSCGAMTATQHAKGSWQPTGEITSFFIEKVANTEAANATTGSLGNMDSALNGGRPYFAYNISYADNDQGSDNEKDAIVRYVIQVTASNQLSIGLEIVNEATCMTMHQGYVISGTSNDGVYLDVGGKSGAASTLGYFLDTAKNRSPGYAESTGTGPNFTDIPKTLTRSTIADPRLFSAGTTAAGEFVPHDMLWYAAKYGGATGDYAGKGNFKLRPNGDPENYYFANNPSTLAAQIGQAFQKAATLGIATASAVGSTGIKVSGGNLVYQASFDTNRWGGELRAFPVLADGNIDNTPTWKVSDQQPIPTLRNVVLGLASASDPRLKSSSINASSFGSLTAGAATFTDDATFKYLLGDRTKEQGGAGPGQFRQRNSAVGDFVNSDPLYIGKSDFGYSGASYAAFKAASDPTLIGIGSNDGFYRLLSAKTGVEQLAFIPATTASKMVKLADPDYTHEYFVDGPSAFGHVNFGTTATPSWNAVVASSFGAGAKGLFALNASATDLATSNNAVLWELNENDSFAGNYIGNILNKSVVAHLTGATGKPVVLVGNGINSANDKASLLVIEADTGKLIKHCTPSDAANSVGNGMSSIVAISDNIDGKINSVYAADYKGNVWRIDPNDSGSLCSTGAIKVFTAKDSAGKLQPITADLTVIPAPSPKTGNMILFGTGKLSSVSDPANKDPQTLYGVWDEYTSTSTAGAVRGDLVAYPFGAYNATQKRRAGPKQADINSGKTWYETAGKKGWMIDLSCSGCPGGERFLDKPLIAGSTTAPVAYFLSYVPGDDPCKPGGDGWVTGIDPATGDFEKAFSKLNDENSVLFGGAAPRGLFIATTAASSTKPAAEYIYISINGDPGTNATTGAGSSSSDVSGAKTDVGTDTISAVGIEVTPPIPPLPALGRRLVWRQIQ